MGLTSSRRIDLYWLAAALLCALVVFVNTLQNGFVFDDHFLIVNNQSLRDPGYLGRVFNPAPQDSPVTEATTVKTSFSAYYRPFTRALFAIVYRNFGVNPIGWHAVNLALYLIVVALTFLLFRRITPRSDIYGPATLLFALHPIHCEAVGWANCLVETLHAIFFIASILFFIISRQTLDSRKTILTFLTSLLMALFAIFCKETAVTISLFVGGYLFFVDKRSEKFFTRVQSAITMVIPYFVVIFFYLFLRHRAGGGLQMAASGNLGSTLRTMPLVIIKYLSLLIAPLSLSPAYPTRPVALFLDLKFILPALLLLTLTAIIAKYYFNQPLLRVGWLLMTLPLLPVLNTGMLLPELIVQDRYLFLPSLGFALILAAIYASLPAAGALPRRMVLALVLVCYGALSIKQNILWQDDLKLFSHAVTVDPQSSFSHINLAGAYIEINDIANAEKENIAALRYNPNCGVCFASLGDIRANQGNLAESVKFYREAILCGYQDLGVLNAYAKGALQLGQFDAAISTLEQLAALQPDSVTALNEVGKAYFQHKNYDKALEWFNRALKVDEKNIDTRYWLAQVYQESGKPQENR